MSESLSKIPIDLAIEKINEYLRKIDDLLKKRYDEGGEELDELRIRIENFIATCLEDGEQRLKRYESLVYGTVAIAAISRQETEEEKQEQYESRLKKMRNFLNAIREELELKSKSGIPKRKR